MKASYLVLGILLLAGCNKAPTDVIPEGETRLPDVLPAATTTPDAVATPQAEMTVTPFKTDDCKPRRYTAEIAWSVPTVRADAGLEVRIGKPDGGLMAYKKGRKSSAKTGNWVSPEVHFFLVDKDTKEIVAQTTSGTYDCQ